MHKENLNKASLAYAVGALLYMPAINISLADDLCKGKLSGLRAAALCMEDAILDDSLHQAEKNLIEGLTQIQTRMKSGELSPEKLPMIFIRIRTAKHMEQIFDQIAQFGSLIAGFILPKFDLTTADAYLDAAREVIGRAHDDFYMMPILESASLLRSENRIRDLNSLKKAIDTLRRHTLNIRVGGNDFCAAYGLRRNSRQTIYEIGVIKSALTDILTIFGSDYVVSAPVWEYFENDRDDAWKQGLERELALDKLNGFIGKTAIHPSQIPVIHRAMAVSAADYEDARKILQWDQKEVGVQKSSGGDRMNEVKVHARWAEKIMTLSKVYGVLPIGAQN